MALSKRQAIKRVKLNAAARLLATQEGSQENYGEQMAGEAIISSEEDKSVDEQLKDDERELKKLINN